MMCEKSTRSPPTQDKKGSSLEGRPVAAFAFVPVMLVFLRRRFLFSIESPFPDPAHLSRHLPVLPYVLKGRG